MKGRHVAVRVPDLAAAKRCYVEKLDFRVVHEWPYADQHLAYLAPATDEAFKRKCGRMPLDTESLPCG